MMKSKPQIKLSLTLLVCFSLFLNSCETEELIDTNDQSATEAYYPSYNSVRMITPDCNIECIEEGSGLYYPVSDFQTGSAGPNTKKVSYEAYNTETQFIVEVTYLITQGNAGTKADIEINISGNVLEFDEVISGSTVSHYIDLPEGWQACDDISFSILQEGLSNPITFNNTYSLIGLCKPDCEESFSYEANDDGSYTFTYISEESLDEAEVKFTCPHITSFEALDGKTYNVNPGNGNGSPTVLTWVGDIEACKALTFTLLFDADCNQNNAEFANIFTDFKVNGTSKKGDNETIKFDCSE